MKEQIKFKDTFFGHLRFFESIVGKHLFFYLILTVIVGLLDGFGLAMFMPLMVVASGEQIATSGEALGNFEFLTSGVEALGLTLNLNIVLILLVLIFGIKGLLRFFQAKYIAYIRFMFLTKIRNGLLNELELLSYKGFLKIDSGRIQNNMVGEVGKLYSGMTSYFLSAQNLILLSTYVTLAFIANWHFAILIGIGSFLTNFAFKKIYIFTRNASKNISLKGHDFNAFLIQAVVYFKYLKATGYFHRYANKLRVVISETEALNLKMGHYSAIMTGSREPLTILIIAVVIGIQVNYLEGSLSSVMVSLLFFYRALTSLTSVQTTWQSFIQNVGSMFSVSTLREEMREMVEPVGVLEYSTPFDKLIARDIELTYGDKVILKDINISISRNQTVAFVGESGAGKTSLANMLVGLIRPSKGGVYVNGNIDLLEYKLTSFRNKIGYITQDPVIFNDTVFNNITFWDSMTEINVARFKNAMEMASLTSFVESLANKENTILGDHGMLVSGGQKQRISIARELYKEVELLILDEATSSLDSETESVIKENIERLKGKYTIIIIAHRLSTIKNADVIYLMNDKKVESFGNFDELMERSNLFNKMVNLQNL